MKKLFCRLLGHTWQHKVDDPKIRWSAAKNMAELELTAAAEPVFYLECVRCKERRTWDDPEVTRELRGARG